MGSRASEIQAGMTHAEVVSILGHGDAGAIPTDFPIVCDSWKYADNGAARYLHVEFMSSLPENRVILVSDGHSTSCLKQRIRSGSPASMVRIGMTREEVISAIGLNDFGITSLEEPPSLDGWAYIQDGTTKYLYIRYGYNVADGSSEQRTVVSITDGHSEPPYIE